MGNANSTPRAEPLLRETHRSTNESISGRARSRSPADNGRSSRLARSRTSSPNANVAQRRQSNIYESFRRQSRVLSPPGQPDEQQTPAPDEGGNEQEERPLVNSNTDARVQESDNTDIIAQSLVRRRSTMSRLGSRLLPDTVMRGLLNSGEETPAEGRALRQGHTARMSPSVWERRVPSNGVRFSLRDSLRNRSTRNTLRRRTIRGPFPLGHTDHEMLSETFTPELRASEESTEEHDGEGNITQRRARLGRFRHSIASPFQSLFHREGEPRQNTPIARNTASANEGLTAADESDHLLPPITGIDHRLDMDDAPHELDAVEPETRNLLSSSRITQGMSTIRRFPHGLRSRSTRLIRRGEHPPLSQVLQLAAAAIAAQLSGHAHPNANGTRPFAGDTFDGSIQNFVQTLQDAASAQAGENIDLNAADGDLPPVNFMRVFQFPNDENGAPITSQVQSHNPDAMDVDNLAQNTEGDRSVTLVLVGVRSMPSSHDGSNGDNGAVGPSLDTLLSLPFLPPTNVLRNGSSGALFRRSDNRVRAHNRRHSMTNFSFPAQYESQRHQRTQQRAPAASSAQDNQINDRNLMPPLSTIPSESPPGPHPPPSTPADMRSGSATPTRRPSSASAVNSAPLADLDEQQDQSSTNSSASTSFHTARQRRRSDSEFARRPELGSGAARRNGVVEPDHPPTGTGRSWLIYVVGTNVSSDHPAFTMPSLFTDNPSYEDMQMLSTLLGPVKPPVASQEDVTSAGGIFRLTLCGQEMLAEVVGDSMDDAIMMRNGDRCLICLCDYEPSEEIRRLNNCQHVYHRECIDEWLTTGRNSCPLCRGQGVTEKPPMSNSTPPQSREVDTS